MTSMKTFVLVMPLLVSSIRLPRESREMSNQETTPLNWEKIVDTETRMQHIGAMNITDDTVTITNFIGRMGNSIIQISNAIEIAENTGAKVVYPKDRDAHGVLNVFNLPDYIAVRRVDKKEQCHEMRKNEGYPFFDALYNSDGKTCFSAKERERVMQTYLLPLLKPNNAAVDEDELVIHLRGGDMLGTDPLTHQPHRPHQPPCKAYAKVIHEKKYEKVRIVASGSDREMSDHPCMETLKSLYIPGVKVTLQNSTALEDFSTLLKARNLFPAFSTFSQVAYVMSDKNAVTYAMIGKNTFLQEGLAGRSLIRVHTAHDNDIHSVEEWYNAPESDYSLVQI